MREMLGNVFGGKGVCAGIVLCHFLGHFEPEHSLRPADDSKEFTRYMIRVLELL